MNIHFLSVSDHEVLLTHADTVTCVTLSNVGELGIVIYHPLKLSDFHNFPTVHVGRVDQLRVPVFSFPLLS